MSILQIHYIYVTHKKSNQAYAQARLKHKDFKIALFLSNVRMSFMVSGGDLWYKVLFIICVLCLEQILKFVTYIVFYLLINGAYIAEELHSLSCMGLLVIIYLYP